MDGRRTVLTLEHFLSVPLGLKTLQTFKTSFSLSKDDRVEPFFQYSALSDRGLVGHSITFGFQTYGRIFSDSVLGLGSW